MSTRRAELFATLARTFAELAELEGAPPVEITVPLPVAPAPPSKPRRKALRLAPVDDRPVSDLASARAAKALRRLGIPT